MFIRTVRQQGPVPACEREGGEPLGDGRRIEHDGRHERLSRELHDRVAQMIAVGLNGVELGEYYVRSGESDRALAKVTDTRKVLGQALAVTKELAARLRLPDGFEADEGPAYDSSGNEFPHDAAISCGDEPPRIDAEQVYLIVREAVSNALVHSGAEEITIHLSVAGPEILASVEDDGAGVAPEHVRSHLSVGLKSMRERTVALGGSFDILRRPRGGTRVQITIPTSRRR